ncbi:hypothetical protein AB0G60_03075 [Streptomyces angustmyceticus]|uniref:Uncharacterized protein n=1 Tax=Streptomyces angustmyceticus TaxID=285578 RepID=A0A5J4L4V9_9ACTN|nr:hypothetical protein [Streptomyces angustmyceticus]UAL65643.1 hypothetical protein K7396_03035 [Streptomyces angustmyceticus]GES27834.1 hypothetical protein San01_03210 [Streptomyces angustmyceticus]
MSIDLLATDDSEAAAFFADARAALAPIPKPSLPEPALPADWPITPAHSGATLTRTQLAAARAHALRISYDGPNGRHAMWVGRWRSGDWSILQGNVGGPASVLTFPHTWDAAVRELTEYSTPDRLFGGDNFTVDEWLPEFTLLCRTHGDDCGEHDDGHHFVQRRTLPRYPAGTYRPCGAGSTRSLGGGGHDGVYQYRYQVEGRWRLRYGCGSHHRHLLGRHLAEADGTVTVRNMDDHIVR